ncbi:peptidase, partial [Corallococcus sp. AB049A]
MRWIVRGMWLVALVVMGAAWLVGRGTQAAPRRVE